MLTLSAATADAAAARRALDAAHDHDLDAVIDADRALYRTKAASELRNASLAIGRRFLDESSLHLDDALLHDYASHVRLDPTLGMQPVAFAVVGSALGVDLEDCVSALLFGSVNAILQAAMRLLRFSHRDAQAILHRLRPRIASLTEACISNLDDQAARLPTAAGDRRDAPRNRRSAPLRQLSHWHGGELPLDTPN